jgi:hypothetical protein
MVSRVPCGPRIRPVTSSGVHRPIVTCVMAGVTGTVAAGVGGGDTAAVGTEQAGAVFANNGDALRSQGWGRRSVRAGAQCDRDRRGEE